MRRSKVAAVTLAACAAMTACGSSAKSTTGSSSSGGGGGAPGVTATSITVGGVGYKTFYSDSLVGAQARLAAQNAQGGVYGRKINLSTFIDDGGSSTANINAVHTLVQQDNVFAVLPAADSDFAGATYLAQAKVPFFGWSVDPLWCNNQYGFGIDGNNCNETTVKTVPNFIGVAQQLLPGGSAKGKAIAVVGEDNASAVDALKGFVAQWKQAGATVVLDDTSIPTPPAVTSDYTPYAQKAMTANGGKPPDYIQTIMTVSDTVAYQAKLRALGYHGVLQNFTLYDPRLAAAATGSYIELTFAPFEQSSPGVSTMISQLKAYDPKVVLDLPAETGWLAADEFIDGLKLAGPKLTRASFMAALNGGKFNPTFQGVAGQAHFPANHSAATPYISDVYSDGTSYSVKVPLTKVPVEPNPLLGG